MEQAIEDMQYSDDPEERAEFIRLFGNKTPSVEEYVYKTMIDIRKGWKKKADYGSRLASYLVYDLQACFFLYMEESAGVFLSLIVQRKSTSSLSSHQKDMLLLLLLICYSYTISTEV